MTLYCCDIVIADKVKKKTTIGNGLQTQIDSLYYNNNNTCMCVYIITQRRMRAILGLSKPQPHTQAFPKVVTGLPKSSHRN